MSNLKEILQKLVEKDHEIYSKVCKVITVDRSKRICNVQPIDDALDMVYNVRLQADMEGAEGFVMFPAVGSYVVVTFLNKNAGYVGLCYKVDEIQLNGDRYGGLIKVQKLTDELNKTKQVVDLIAQTLQSWSPVANDGGAALKVAATAALAGKVTGTYTNLTNDLVKHG